MAASPVFQSPATALPSPPDFGALGPVGRPFILFPPPASLLTQLRDTPKLSAITPASRLEVRPSPEMVSSGIPELDALTGGWPRGCLSEICGSVSSGRTTIALSALAQATQRGEASALVDASDVLDPASAAAAGVEMGRLLWVRCGKRNSPKGNSLATDHCPLSTDRLEQVLKITDLLLQSNGFGMIVLDLADIPALSARRIPLASWFRFRRAVEHTPTVLLVIEQQPIAGSCSSVLLQVSGGGSQVAGFRCDEQTEVSGKKPSAFSHQHQVSGIGFQVSGKTLSIKWAQSADQEKAAVRPSHTELLDQFEITAELLRSRLERKPAQSVVNFRSRAKWAR
jgi:recA bacterial DNA recombination protein